MRKITLLFAFLLTLCATLSARTVTRCFDPESQKFCVRVDGKMMTVAEYDNWLYANYPSAYLSDTVLVYWMKRHITPAPEARTENFQNFSFATRTMRWAGKELTAWVIIDDTGHECSHWVFAGSDSANGDSWWLYAAELDRVWVVLVLCADTLCQTEGYLDKNAKLFMWTGGDNYGPWDWKIVLD